MTHTWGIQMPFDFPDEMIEGIEYTGTTNARYFRPFRNGSYQSIPGITTPGDLSLTLYEDEQLTSRSFLLQWSSLIMDPTQNFYNNSAVYKQNITLYPQTSNWQNSGTITFVGCFPTELPGYLFNSEVQRSNITVSISIDAVTVQVQNSSVFGGALTALGKQLPFLNPLIKTVGAQLTGITNQLGANSPVKISNFLGQGSSLFG